jgi:hypothetical protein
MIRSRPRPSARPPESSSSHTWEACLPRACNRPVTSAGQHQYKRSEMTGTARGRFTGPPRRDSVRCSLTLHRVDSLLGTTAWASGPGAHLSPLWWCFPGPVRVTGLFSECNPPVRTSCGTRSSYNPQLSTSRPSMEAERLNQIEGTVADLRGRLAELRRYL